MGRQLDVSCRGEPLLPGGENAIRGRSERWKTGYYALLDEAHAKHAGVKIDILLRVARDRGDVMESGNLGHNVETKPRATVWPVQLRDALWRFSASALVHHSALHHETDTLCRVNVREWIAGHGDDVRELPCRE